MINDLIFTSKEKNDEFQLQMSDDVLSAMITLRKFLYDNVYEAHRVHNDFIKAQKILRELYDYFLNDDDFFESEEVRDDNTLRHRAVCDFIAGMTDHYALDLYQNIFLPKPWSVK